MKCFIEKCRLSYWDYKSCFYIDGLIKIYVSLVVLTMCSVSHKTMTSKCITISSVFNTTAFPLQHDVVSRLDCGKIMWIGFNNMKKLLWKLDGLLYELLNNLTCIIIPKIKGTKYLMEQNLLHLTLSSCNVLFILFKVMKNLSFSLILMFIRILPKRKPKKVQSC